MLKIRKKYRTVLTIAGSDSGAGAGVQADLKTISALGCYGLTVITALTAQNTQGVSLCSAVDPVMIEAQLQAVFADIQVDAIKIGMLHNSAAVETVLAFLQSLGPQLAIPIVFDPVMVATSGDSLSEVGLLEPQQFCEDLQKLAAYSTVLTPNADEAEALTGIAIECDPCNNDRVQAQMIKQARRLIELGAKAVLLKGGHFETDNDCLYDLLYWQGKTVWFDHQKIKTNNTHGTGCTLSTAIASYLARGKALPEAVDLAIQFLQGAIRHGVDYALGKGHGPVHHCYSWWS